MRRLSLLTTKIATLLMIIASLISCSATRSLERQEPSVLPAASEPITAPTADPVDIAQENFRKAWREEFESTLNALEANRSRWRASGVRAYRFVVAKYAGGNSNTWNRLPVVITVHDGNRSSIEKESKDNDHVIYSRTDGFDDFDTFDKLFDYLRAELERGRMITAKYDRELGYPRNVGIEFASHTHGWQSIRIPKFERIR